MRNLLLAVFLGSFSALHAQVLLTSPSVQDGSLKPGESMAGIIRVHNEGDEVAAVGLYVTDMVRRCDPDQIAYPEPGDGHPRSAAGWVRLSRTSVNLVPGGTEEIPYTLSVPPEFAGSGTYWATIMASPEKASQDVEVQDPAPGIQVMIENRIRYASLVLATIGPMGAEAVGFGTRSLVRNQMGKNDMLVTQINNQRKTFMYGLPSLELFSRDGEFVAKREGVRQLLLPESCTNLKVPLDGVASGTYKALLVVDGGGDNLFGTSFDLDL